MRECPTASLVGQNTAYSGESSELLVENQNDTTCFWNEF